MYGLAHLSSSLLEESNLSERAIKRAIEIGLTPKEELEKEAEQMKKDLEKKLQELFRKIS